MSSLPWARPPISRREPSFRGGGARSRLRTDRAGIPERTGRAAPGTAPPSPPTFAPRPRQPRSPCAEKKPGRSSRALEQKASDRDPCAYRRENNDRTGSAWGWASGSPSRQASLSRNLGGALFSLGVQYRYRPVMGAKALRGRVQVDWGTEPQSAGHP